MSMFNEYQLDHMQWLSEQPREKLCQCGWYKKNECPNTHCCDDAKQLEKNKNNATTN